jgi:hypothetical protein
MGASSRGQENRMDDAWTTIAIVVGALTTLAVVVWFLMAKHPEHASRFDPDRDPSGRDHGFIGRPAGPDAENQDPDEFGREGASSGHHRPNRGMHPPE